MPLRGAAGKGAHPAADGGDVQGHEDGECTLSFLSLRGTCLDEVDLRGARLRHIDLSTVSDLAPGHLHDLTVARNAGVIGALNWAASQLDLPT